VRLALRGPERLSAGTLAGVASEDVEIADEIQREGDAPRRTYLANERTFLAWWRSGLAAMTIGFAVGKFGPAVGSSEDEWPYVLLGVAFVLLGGAMVFYGLHRRHEIDAALEAGRRIPSDEGWFAGFTIATLVLGAGLLLVLIVGA
jgi:putative membrane protein